MNLQPIAENYFKQIEEIYNREIKNGTSIIDIANMLTEIVPAHEFSVVSKVHISEKILTLFTKEQRKDLATELLEEQVIRQRKKLNHWSTITAQSAQIDTGYIAQHLVSLQTQIPGQGMRGKGDDLCDGSEVKSANFLDSMDKKEAELRKVSEAVSQLRRDKSVSLVEAIVEALRDLNFLDVKFEMNFELLSDYTSNGIDDAQFMISTNPGEPVKPLGKIASGGELSRIMLGIKTVMAENDRIESLIFDEIDSGISGRTAQMVSEKMNALGRNHQIICITHLPQIAAMADSHFLIEKSVENSSTFSNIYKLDEESSVNELARMLGGVEITDTVIESAREMKKMAQNKK